MLCKVTHCAGRVSANTRPHQLRWGDREMGTAISCIECSQVAGLIQKSNTNRWKTTSVYYYESKWKVKMGETWERG